MAHHTSRTSGRTLVTGWFSFPHGEATAGDVLALWRVQEVLDGVAAPYDVAWSPRFRPGALSLADARPYDYTQLVFVCGPLHGPDIAALHRRFTHCHRIAVGTTVLDPDDPAAAGFHQILARDGAHPAHATQDLAARAPDRGAGRVPVAGVVLTQGQREYGERRLHAAVAATVYRWLARTACAPVLLETRLDRGDGRLCQDPGQFLSVVERVDAVVTDRLHGLVLALRAGVPALALDPVRGGAKVTAQARACRWPAVVPGECLTEDTLDTWWAWCLGEGRHTARRRRQTMATASDAADELRAALPEVVRPRGR